MVLVLFIMAELYDIETRVSDGVKACRVVLKLCIGIETGGQKVCVLAWR